MPISIISNSPQESQKVPRLLSDKAAKIYFRKVRLPHNVWLKRPELLVEPLRRYPYSRFVFDTFKRSNPDNFPELLDSILPETVSYQYWVAYKYHAFRYVRGNSMPVERAPLWHHNDDPDLLAILAENAPRYQYKTIFLRIRNNGGKPPEIALRVAATYPNVQLFCLDSNRWYSNIKPQFAHFSADPHAMSVYGSVFLPAAQDLINGRKGEQPFRSGYSRDAEARKYFSMFTDMPAEQFRYDEQGLAALSICSLVVRAAIVGREPYYVMHSNDTHCVTKAEVYKYFASVVDPEHWLPGVAERPIEEFIPEHDFRSSYGPPGATDRFLCDSCSLANKCPLFRREGGLCRVDKSLSDLIELFGSPDVETVQKGLSRIVQMQAQRYYKHAEAWDDTVEEIREEAPAQRIQKSKHLLELENSIVKSAENLIKLMDPSKNGNGPQIAIVNHNGGQTATTTPAALAADVLRQLEASGVPRNKVTPAMVEQAIGEAADGELVD